MTICVIGAADRGIEIAVDDHSTVEVRMCADPAVDHGDADTAAGQRSQTAPGADRIDDRRVDGGEGGRVEGRIGQLDRGVVDDAFNI